jgi:hypothetical protein
MYNATVEIYYAMSSLVNFEKKFYKFENTLYPTYYVVVVNFEIVGLAPGINPIVASLVASSAL